MKSFITGSRDYGSPTANSDIDLVILVSKEDAEFLKRQSDLGNLPTKFGKLNLIIADNENDFNIWFMARELCRKAARKTPENKISRSKAVEIHRKLFAEYGRPGGARFASKRKPPDTSLAALLEPITDIFSPTPEIPQ